MFDVDVITRKFITCFCIINRLSHFSFSKFWSALYYLEYHHFLWNIVRQLFSQWTGRGEKEKKITPRAPGSRVITECMSRQQKLLLLLHSAYILDRKGKTETERKRETTCDRAIAKMTERQRTRVRGGEKRWRRGGCHITWKLRQNETVKSRPHDSANSFSSISFDHSSSIM